MIRDLTLPILSFFTGISFSQARFRILLLQTRSQLPFLQAVRQALGGSSSIEDLLIPFFCISTNLSQLDQEVCAARSALASLIAKLCCVYTGSRKRQAVACSARFNDCGWADASHVQVWLFAFTLILEAH